MTGITITSDEDRAFLQRMIQEAKIGTVVEMRVDPASEPQKRKMWASIGDVAKQVQHNGRYYAPAQWCLLFMHACGQEVEMMPSLDGSTFLPYDGRSSKMNSRDMSEMISFIDAWGAQNGVEFKE
jgi:hypothetical protein